jgi:hypothetical protein
MPHRRWRDKNLPHSTNVASPFKGGACRANPAIQKEEKEALCVHFELFRAPQSLPRH